MELLQRFFKRNVENKDNFHDILGQLELYIKEIVDENELLKDENRKLKEKIKYLEKLI